MNEPRQLRTPLIRAVIFDLDGVIRHFDRTHEADIEARFGLERGALLRAAFGGEIGQRFMRGEIGHGEFEAALAPVLGSRSAAAEFVSMEAILDPLAVDLVLEVQRSVDTALLTNGSTRTRWELAQIGIDKLFEHVFNSAETGVPKPHPEAYLAACRHLEVAPEATAFIDDTQANVDGAISAGLCAHRFTDIDGTRAFLVECGVLRHSPA